VRARRSRWIGRGGGALLVSVVAHAMAAVTVGVALRAPAGPSVVADPVAVDVDLAPAAVDPVQNGVPAASTSPDRPEAPKPRRAAPARRPRTSSEAAAPLVSGSSAVATPDPDEPPMRFALAAGTVAMSPVSPAASASQAGVAGGGGQGDVVSEGDVSVPARLLASSPLVYPPAARSAEIETDLPVEIVVDAEGRVVAARALTRAGYGLDEAALRAIRAYRFSPALRQGLPVRVRMRWTVQFRLR
jgi:protein TonB